MPTMIIPGFENLYLCINYIVIRINERNTNHSVGEINVDYFGRC